MALWLEGMVVGFSIAAPVGAIGFLCIQQTLQGGMLMGLATGLGAATADTIYGILVALGLRLFQTVILTLKIPLSIGGGLFLCYLGIKKFFVPLPVKNNEESRPSELVKAYITTFFLTLTNPATILDFIALFSGLTIDTHGLSNSLSFVAGVFLGSALWWLLLSFSVGIFRNKISRQILSYINYLAGLVILGFGIYCLYKVFYVAHN